MDERRDDQEVPGHLGVDRQGAEQRHEHEDHGGDRCHRPRGEEGDTRLVAEGREVVDAGEPDDLPPGVRRHILAGVVVDGPRAGQRVAIDPQVPCGACETCATGRGHLCPQVRFLGHSTTDGALRELMAWPTANLVPLPDTIDDVAGAMLEPLGVGIHALRLARVRPGDTVGIFGCGPIGLLLIQLARDGGQVERLRIGEELPDVLGSLRRRPVPGDALAEGDRVEVRASSHVSHFVHLQDRAYFYRTLMERLRWRGCHCCAATQRAAFHAASNRIEARRAEIAAFSGLQRALAEFSTQDANIATLQQRGVRVLGPARKYTQVEIAMTEQFKLGVHPPIRESGDIADTPGCTLEGTAGSVKLDRGVICALRHVHMTPADALRYGVRDKSFVRVRITGDRELVFGDVLVRVRAVALNGFDPMILKGIPGLRTPMPHVPGGDIAGEIAAVGAAIVLIRDLFDNPLLFAQIVLSGLQLGFVYAMIALGYSMVYGVLGLINFAHSDIFMIGAFIAYYAGRMISTGNPWTGAALILLLNLAVDLIYGWLDPRIRG